MFFITFKNKVSCGGSYGIESCKAFCNKERNVFKTMSADNYGKVIAGAAHEPNSLNFVKTHDFCGNFIITVVAFGLNFKFDNCGAIVGIDFFPVNKCVITDDDVFFSYSLIAAAISSSVFPRSAES